MAEFWAYDPRYKWGRKYVDFITRHSFRKIEIEGSLPEDGRAIIISPNHTGTLMDALLVLLLRKEGILFGARADVFRNPKVARLLHFFKIVPLARKDRDRPDEVRHNMEVFDYIDDVLGHGMPYCMFPEGRHKTEHRILPLKKGIAHIALRSAAQRPTAIVPVGIEYSDWFHFRQHTIMRIGEPMDIKADDNADDVLEALKGQMESLIYIGDNPPVKRQSTWSRVLQTIIGLPLFLVSAVVSLPLWLTAELLCGKVKDKAFSNTMRYGVKLLLSPLNLYLPFYTIFYDWLNVVNGRI